MAVNTRPLFHAMGYVPASGTSHVTVTEYTPTAVTVTEALPLLPSLVAVIVEVPAPRPVTEPVLDTVAADGFDDDQVTVRPVRMLFAASRSVATNCCVPPAEIVAVSGVTDTVLTGAAWTVTAAVPILPSAVAEIVAVPAATPVTTPPLVTDATALLDVDHVMVRPVTVSPQLVRGVAVRTAVPPIEMVGTGLGVTSTLDTTSG